MSESISKGPAMYARIDAPPAVTSAISAAKAACAAWPPIQVGTPEHPASPMQMSMEAPICDELLRPADQYPLEFKVGVGVGIFAAIAAILVWKLLTAGYRVVLAAIHRKPATV